jgi:carbonic anhydrase
MAVDHLVPPMPPVAAGGDMGAGAMPEKPQNGVAGLKYWRNDIVSGLLVSMISLPFSLGIAVASGAPPICGLTSAIIAGLVFPFVGGSYMTIAGPAAGLAPVLLAAMVALGGGTDEAHRAIGYPLLLVVICFTGVVQIVLSLLKAAKYAAFFPSAVVEGMLAAIGLMIIAKEMPHFLGVKFAAHDFFAYVMEAPKEIVLMNWRVVLTASLCLALIFVLSAAKSRRLKVVPPQLIAVVFGIVVARLLGLTGDTLITIPSGLAHGIVMPNFAGLLAARNLWLAAGVALVTLTMVDGVESLATASAIDKIDPFRRKSQPNRVLLAMGVSNILSSLAGGLTIIPGGVKSKANIEGGGRTLWANFYNAIFLLIFIFVASPLINMIPFAALSAVLIHIGFKLCRPKIWRHVWSIGREQLLIFTLTVVVTLYTDLLIGIIAGMVAKLLMTLSLTSAASTPGRVDHGVFRRFFSLFRSPVRSRELIGDAYHLEFAGPIVSFNSLAVNKALDETPKESRSVVLHFSDDVTLIDHTSCENLRHFAEEYERNGRGQVWMEGIDQMKPLSRDENSLRMAAGGLIPGHPLVRAVKFFRKLASRKPSPPRSKEADLALLDHLALEDHDNLNGGHADLAWTSLSSSGLKPVTKNDLDKFSLSDNDMKPVK